MNERLRRVAGIVPNLTHQQSNVEGQTVLIH